MLARCWWRLSFAVLSFLPILAWSAEDGSAPPPRQAQIDDLIRQLDAPRYAERQQAELQLLQLGREAIPALAKAMRHPSPEVRRRATRVVEQWQQAHLASGFRKLAETADDAKVDVEEGMLLISELVRPETDREAVRKRLDELAKCVREKLGPDVNIPKADPQQVIDAIRTVIFEEEGFHGDNANYDHPDNSSIHRVLEMRRGLPILLSHVVLAVARRLDFPLAGLPLPGRYKVVYAGKRTADEPARHIVMDAFDGGKVLSSEELAVVLRRMGYSFDAAEDLKPGTHKAALARMLSNLETHLSLAGEDTKAWQAQIYREMLEASEPKKTETPKSETP